MEPSQDEHRTLTYFLKNGVTKRKHYGNCHPTSRNTTSPGQNGRCRFPSRPLREDDDHEDPRYVKSEVEQGAEGPAPALQEGSSLCKERQGRSEVVGHLSGNCGQEAQACLRPGHERLFR